MQTVRMAEARRLWALMAVLTTIALTSFSVEAILEDESTEISFKTAVTGNAVAEESEEKGFSGMIQDAAEWVMKGE